MKDELSALMDGDLDEQSTRRVLDAIRRDPALREKWETYCAIGDVLRGDTVGAEDFSRRVMDQIRLEPTMLAPKPAAGRAPGRRRAVVRSSMALAASLMGVTAVGWVAYTLYPQSEQGTSVAVAPVATRAVDVALRQNRPVLPIERDDAYRNYVFVHQATNGGGLISSPVQHVRAVSDARGDARR